MRRTTLLLLLLSLPAAADTTVAAAPGKGFTIKNDDGITSLTLRPRVQLRDTVQLTPVDGKVTNEAQVKTLRLITSGNVLVKDLNYQLQLAFGTGDFEPGNPSPVLDAWVEYAALPAARVRVGQFFVPFDRARTIREFALQFTDRQQVVRELTLDRDVGVMVHGPELLDGWLGYALFLGTGDGRNRVGGLDPSPLLVARVFTRPLGAFDDDVEGDLSRELKPRVAVGAAFAFDQQAGRTLSTNGPLYPAGAADAVHGAVDVVCKYGGFSLLSEALVRQVLVDEVRGEVDGKEVVTATRSGAGAFVQAGFFVTEQLEIVGRYEKLVAFAGTDEALTTFADTQGQQAGGGVNFYLNGHALKLQADTFTVFGSAGVNKQVARVQLDATF